MKGRAAVAALVVGALLGAGLTLGVQALLGGGDDPQPAFAHFSNDRYHLSFDYPSSWRRQAYEVQSSFSTSIVFLSTTRMHNPCTTTKKGEITEETCGMAVDTLGEDGIVVEWTANGFPGGAQHQGFDTTIAGRPAKILQETPGTCKGVIADTTITAYIDRGVTDNWYQMLACLKGPDLDKAQGELALMLATVQVVE